MQARRKSDLIDLPNLIAEEQAEKIAQNLIKLKDGVKGYSGKIPPDILGHLEKVHAAQKGSADINDLALDWLLRKSVFDEAADKLGMKTAKEVNMKEDVSVLLFTENGSITYASKPDETYQRELMYSSMTQDQRGPKKQDSGIILDNFVQGCPANIVIGNNNIISSPALEIRKSHEDYDVGKLSSDTSQLINKVKALIKQST